MKYLRFTTYVKILQPRENEETNSISGKYNLFRENKIQDSFLKEEIVLKTF